MQNKASKSCFFYLLVSSSRCLPVVPYFFSLRAVLMFLILFRPISFTLESKGSPSPLLEFNLCFLAFCLCLSNNFCFISTSLVFMICSSPSFWAISKYNSPSVNCVIIIFLKITGIILIISINFDVINRKKMPQNVQRYAV